MTDLNFDGLTDAQLRLFAVRCARRVQHLMIDPRSIAALDVAERYVKGEATDNELASARVSAGDASDAAWASWAAWAAAAYSASRAARDGAARAAAAAADAERAAQAEILEQIRQEQPR